MISSDRLKSSQTCLKAPPLKQAMETAAKPASEANGGKNSLQPSKMPPLISTMLRFFIYAALGWVQMAVIRLAALEYGTGGFSDNRIVENLQLATLGASGVVLLISAICFPAVRGLGLLLATLATLGCMREMDQILDNVIPFLGWKAAALAVFVIGCALVWRHRQGIANQLRAFLAHRAFALMWAGGLMVVCFAQMMGQGSFLQQLLGDDYTRGTKRLIEEGTEIFGYFLVFIGSLELVFHSWQAARREKAETDE